MSVPKIRILLCAAALSALLTGCSSDPVVDQGIAPPPPNLSEQATPAKPAPIDQLRALTSPEGMSYKPLFEEKMDDEDERLSRLEEAVEALRIDMDMVVAPAVVKLNEDGVEEEPAAPAVSAAAAPPPQPPARITPAEAQPENKAPVAEQPVAATDVSVKGVRIGDHPDKTRIVLDISAKLKPAVSFAHENTQMIVDLSGATWDAPSSFQADTAKLVASWVYKDGKFVADLLNASELKKIIVLDPLPGQSTYRLVLDIAPK